MKMKTSTARKLRYGGVSAALTAIIIAIVIVGNVAFTALAEKLLWYTDLTPTVEFTLSEECITVFEKGDTSFEGVSKTDGGAPLAKIDEVRENLRKENPDMSEKEIKEQTMMKIIFCDTKEEWSGDDIVMKYVWKTAADLQKEFKEYIELEFVDIYLNPTAVRDYDEGGTLVQTSVIITWGEEFRVRALSDFYRFPADDDEKPNAYQGEKIFAAAAMAITRAETPKAYFTMGHDEIVPSEDFILMLANAGYEYGVIDLTQNDIPDDCRLLIISSPQSDFLESDGIVETDEILAIEDYLEKSNSLLVIMDPNVEPLTNLEGFLEEWGIAFDRYEDKDSKKVYSKEIRETVSFYDSVGKVFGAQNVTYGLGNDFTASIGGKMRFSNAMAMEYSSTATVGQYKETVGGENLGVYATIKGSGTSIREVYPVFTASENAVAWSNDKEVEVAKNGNVFELMMVSVEDHIVQEENAYRPTTVDQASYVLACACPEFFSDNALQGSYGNAAFLEHSLRRMGHEPVPIGLVYRAFGDYTIDTLETNVATWCTVILTALPLVAAAGVGIVVIVRRKNR